MDNNYYGQNQYAQKERPQKRPGFGAGILTGILLGTLILGIGIWAGTRAYTMLTGRYVVIGPSGTAVTTYGGSLLDQDTVDRIEELIAYMDLYFYDGYEAADIQSALCKGTLNGLKDPYSVYYTKEEYEDLQISTNGNYHGIGAGLSQNEKTMEVTITKVYDKTPAKEAGLMDGDRILMVIEIEAASMELTNLVREIRGEEGTTVHLLIYRESTGETLDFDVERRNVELPSVTGTMMEGGIGYIEITEFQGGTAGQFAGILEELQEQGMKGMVVDLRGNPGGLITSVVDILDMILPEGVVVYTEDKYGRRENYTSDARCLDIPMVVLINENSASASEIFAGAVKDYEYGTLVGTTSFGKGIVQSLFPLEDGSAVKLTTAKYFTPKGNNIHGIGIAADVEVEYEYTGPADEPYDIQYDNQAQRAFALMEEMLE